MSVEEAHPDPHDLPKQERGITPQMVGRYPHHDVLTQTDHWDELTRKVVRDRVDHVPPIVYFDASEAQTLKAFCEVVTAQDSEPRVAVLSYIDEKLQAGKRDGWRFYDLPDDGDLWRLLARGLDHEAQAQGFKGYGAAPLDAQVEIVHRFSKADLHGAVWDTINVARAFSVVMRYVAQAFYSHPFAWNEIGFSGPAYPRGYAAFGAPHLGEQESWETPESVHYDPVTDTRKRGLD